MLKRLLVVLNYLGEAHPVHPLAIDYARTFGAAVTALAVVDDPGITHPEPVPAGGGAYKRERDRELLHDCELKSRAALDEFARQCATAGVTAQTMLAWGDPLAEIQSIAPYHDVVLAGRHAQFRFRAHHGDATITELLKHGSRPVLSVTDAVPSQGPVILAYDGSLAAARALATIWTLGLNMPRTCKCDHI